MAALMERLDADSLLIMETQEVCKFRFPSAREYRMTLWPELRDFAFSPLINNLFHASTLEATLDTVTFKDYFIVAPARQALYCCSGVRMLTASLFDGLTYDTVAHGYYKRHRHMTFTAEIFGLASTIVSNITQLATIPLTKSCPSR